MAGRPHPVTGVVMGAGGAGPEGHPGGPRDDRGRLERRDHNPGGPRMAGHQQKLERQEPHSSRGCRGARPGPHLNFGPQNWQCPPPSLWGSVSAPRKLTHWGLPWALLSTAVRCPGPSARALLLALAAELPIGVPTPSARGPTPSALGPVARAQPLRAPGCLFHTLALVPSLTPPRWLKLRFRSANTHVEVVWLCSNSGDGKAAPGASWRLRLPAPPQLRTQPSSSGKRARAEPRALGLASPWLPRPQRFLNVHCPKLSCLWGGGGSRRRTCFPHVTPLSGSGGGPGALPPLLLRGWKGCCVRGHFADVVRVG